MKKFTVFAVLLSLLCLCLPAEAVTAQTPVILSAEERQEQEDTLYSFRVKSEVSSAEELRLVIYEGLKSKGYTDAMFIAKNLDYLFYRTADICQIKTEESSWKTVKSFYGESKGAEENTYTLSLRKDIIPAFEGEEARPFSEGTEIWVRFITASENISSEKNEKVFVESPPSDGRTSFRAEKTGIILYNLPEGGVNSEENIKYFTPPLEEDIILGRPFSEGRRFRGWTDRNGKAVDRIEKGSAFAQVFPHWNSINYSIRYITATIENYPLGGAGAGKNPSVYTVESAVPLLDLKSPVPGFTFGGWYENEDFSGERIYKIPEGSTGDRVFYAKWINLKEKEEEERNRKEEYIKNFGYGDVNDDLSVTSADARIILRYCVELQELDGELLKRADYDGSGKITSSNARATLRAAVELETMYDILISNGVDLDEKIKDMADRRSSSVLSAYSFKL